MAGLALGVREDALLVRDTEVEKTSVSDSKAGTAPNYKGEFGFHPLSCLAEATGGSLSGMGRAGSAAANDMVDLLTVVDDAIAQLPPDVTAGHQPGDAAAGVNRDVVVHSDSTGGTKAFTNGSRRRNIGFQVVARTQTTISAAIKVANEDPTR